MNRNLFICALLLLVWVTSCSKTDEQPVTKVTTSDTTFRLLNGFTEDLYVDLYTSLEDRKNGTHKKYSCLVPANGTYKIPFSQLDTMAAYCYDVYAADGSLSSWPYNNAVLFPLFRLGHSYNLVNELMSGCAYYYLHGNEAASTWVAVDKHDYTNNSLWSSLDENGRYFIITINRDLSGSVATRRTDGTIRTDAIYNISNNPFGDGSTRMAIQANGSYYFTYNSPIIPNYNFSNQWSRDTMNITDDNSNFWMVVRQ